MGETQQCNPEAYVFFVCAWCWNCQASVDKNGKQAGIRKEMTQQQDFEAKAKKLLALQKCAGGSTSAVCAATQFN